jgi:3-methyl-2-oxobutanoate hydroxymethyltransferase
MADSDTSRVTIPHLHRMKREGRKIVGAVVWDQPLARIVDGLGVEIISVSAAVGGHLWGHRNPLAVTMEQMITVAQAVRRGVDRALTCVDMPYGALQEGPEAAVRGAVRLVKATGADMVRLADAADFPDSVEAVARAGVPVMADLGPSPQLALRHGLDLPEDTAAPLPAVIADTLIDAARRLEKLGVAALDFSHGDAALGSKVVHAVHIPVLGGDAGGPWLDGRIRTALAVVGYGGSGDCGTYADVSGVLRSALSAYAADVRAARPLGAAAA